MFPVRNSNSRGARTYKGEPETEDTTNFGEIRKTFVKFDACADVGAAVHQERCTLEFENPLSTFYINIYWALELDLTLI